MKVKVYIGVMGSGKDYRATLDCSVKYAFADKLREDIWTMIGWKPETDVDYQDFKSNKFVIFPGSGITFTGRNLMQRYGNEVRRKENPQHWVECLISKLKKLNSLPESRDLIVGVSDCRFPNEVKALKGLRRYGIDVEFIHTNFESDRYTVDSSHASEKLAVEALQFWGKEKEFQEFIENI